MRDSWESYETAAKRGPLSIMFKVFIALTIFSVVTGVVGYGLGWFGEAAQVAQEEFGPRRLLEKYEWFKDAAAQLDAKHASIATYEASFRETKQTYGADALKWPRDVREDLSVRSQAVAGLKASYNTLAADYNSQMAKFNWRFTNAGDLPQGATQVLPREFRAYVTE